MWTTGVQGFDPSPHNTVWWIDRASSGWVFIPHLQVVADHHCRWTLGWNNLCCKTRKSQVPSKLFINQDLIESLRKESLYNFFRWREGQKCEVPTRKWQTLGWKYGSFPRDCGHICAWGPQQTSQEQTGNKDRTPYLQYSDDVTRLLWGIVWCSYHYVILLYITHFNP